MALADRASAGTRRLRSSARISARYGRQWFTARLLHVVPSGRVDGLAHHFYRIKGQVRVRPMTLQ